MVQIIPPQFTGDRFQVVRIEGYHSYPIAWCTSLADAMEVKERHGEKV